MQTPSFRNQDPIIRITEVSDHDWPFSIRHLRRYQGGHVPCAAQALRPLIRMAGERSARMEGQEASRFAVGLLIRASASAGYAHTKLRYFGGGARIRWLLNTDD